MATPGSPRGRAYILRPTMVILRVHMIFVVLLVGVVGVSCARGDPSNSASGVAPSPTSKYPTFGQQALLTGYLVGDPATNCVWVDAKDPSSNTGRPGLIKWPSDVQPRTDPVRLLAADGSVIAKEGDFLHLAGGSTHPDAPAHPCSTDGSPPDFVVSKIEKVIPADP